MDARIIVLVKIYMVHVRRGIHLGDHQMEEHLERLLQAGYQVKDLLEEEAVARAIDDGVDDALHWHRFLMQVFQPLIRGNVYDD